MRLGFRVLVCGFFFGGEGGGALQVFMCLTFIFVIRGLVVLGYRFGGCLLV